MTQFEVPPPHRSDKVGLLAQWIEEHGYATLYLIGDTRVIGRRGQIGGRKVYADPGDVLVLEDGELRVGRDDS